jgi:2-haloalkanoic acid dehalogenase type II
MTIKAITFDLDDTLWDVSPVISRAEQQVHDWLTRYFPAITKIYSIENLRELRTRLTDELAEHAHNFTHLRRETIYRAAQAAGYDPQAVADSALKVFMDARHEVEFYEEVLNTLESLSQRYILGALSNGNADLTRVGIDHHFKFHLSAVKVGKPKPHATMFKIACELARAHPFEVVHIGDHPEHDVAGAAAIGMRTIWINRNNLEWNGDKSPDAVICNLTEIEALLSAWNQAE